jgi:sugar-specific transcriptional regulator TrmB
MPETNTQISYISSLQLAGLTPEQAEIYQVLLKNGPLPAGKIHQKTPYKRGLVYKLLDSMVESGVVIKRTDLAKIAIFEPAHPLKLKELAETKEKEAKQAQSALTGIIDQMTSEYNLVSGKPGVQFFEGIEGVKKVAIDTLTSKTEILQYLDVETLEQSLPTESDYYTNKRISLKIKKRLLIRSSQFAQNLKLIDDDFSTHKYFNTEKQLSAVIYIYDDKFAMVTLDKDRLMGVIITNPIIAQTEKELFEALWNKSDNKI